MNSNIGAEHLVSTLEEDVFTKVEARGRVMQEVKEHFRPRFLNNLDEILVFDTLSHEEMRGIVSLHLDDVGVCLADQKGDTLEMTDEALDFVLRENYSPVDGAWPIKRLVKNDCRAGWEMLNFLGGALRRGWLVNAAI